MLLGIFAVTVALFGLMSMISGVVVPLVIAVVIGMLFVPLVDLLDRALPRPLAAAIVLLALLGIAAVTITLAVAGAIDQAPEIGDRLADGFDELIVWLDGLELQIGGSEELVEGLEQLWVAVMPGLAGYLSTVFSSTAAFLAGTFVAVFLLYFILADWSQLAGWVARHLGVAEDVGLEIVHDATWSMRQYFVALTVSSLIVSIIVGGSAAFMGVPLAFSIAVVTFFTSYIPYLGALFSGAFAVLIALGASGTRDALVLLTVVLVAQNVVQTVVQTVMSQDRLSLHPIVIFGSTLVGGALFGLVGAALSTPAVAIIVRVTRRLAEQRRSGTADAGSSVPTTSPPRGV